MAKSYVCGDCGLMLRNLKEAQDHGETTGHANFSESEEAVLTLVCVECGKPCRSATEKSLHTQRTGHAEFVDKTAEQNAVNTEEQMKDLRTEQGIEDEAGEMEVDEPADLVPASVNEDLLKQLEEMGFGRNRATRAIHFTGTNTLEQAVNWIVEHEADADIDEPLLLPKETEPKVKLTKEEAKAKAAELVRKAKEKKEAEEREMEKLREKERIRSGKEIAEAKRIEQDQERKRILEWRKREKEEEAKARAKIKAKLEEDRKERRRKLGLPEEYTPEELAEIEAKERQKAEAEKEKAAASENRPKPKPITLQTELRNLLVQMKQAHKEESDRVTKAFNTLLTYLGNIVRAPAEDKFRRINLNNAAFQARLGSLSGGVDFLVKCGFERDDASGFLVMPPEKVQVDVLNLAGGEINNALSNPFFGVL